MNRGSHSADKNEERRSVAARRFLYYVLAILLGIIAGISDIAWLFEIGSFCSEAFIRMFRCISMPIISLSVIVALSRYGEEQAMGKVWKRTLMYTLSTTLAAVTLSALLYYFIAPENVRVHTSEAAVQATVSVSYVKHLLTVIPENIVGAFLECQVLAILVLSLMAGVAVRFIPNKEARKTIQNFFDGLHGMLFAIIKWIVALLPIGLFGFITIGIRELNTNTSLQGMGAYFLVITLANILQGTLVLPLFLLLKGQSPVRVFRGMAPALSVAFFTKSSAGTLPVTMQRAETKLGVRSNISRFVLPLCTTINMNGCGAFIFTTVLYVMQNHGYNITPTLMIPWVLIATLAAIGNAGVPMGCFFLSASLLSSMKVPLELMGMILPFYSIIDMLETALNVWSDACVTVAVDGDMKALT